MQPDLTDAFLQSVKPPEPGARLELRDSRVPGLVLRMTATGTATWSVRTRTKDGKQTRPKLGTWPALSIAAARRAALKALGSIETGADPVGEKREARAARKVKVAAGVTVAKRLAEWQAGRNADPTAAWSDRYAAEVARIAAREIVPKLGARALTETTRADWAGLVAAKRKTAPAMASALYRVVASFLGYAEANGWIAAPLLPRKGVATLAPPPAARERVLTDAELLAVWQAADREAPKLRAFVRLLILTAARELEVADMAAGEVDREAGRWSIPGARSKNGTGYSVPLAGLALAELANVWPNEEPDAAHLLLGRGARSGFRGFSRLKGRLDAASNVEGWRFHDLRRTARTGMTRLGVPRDHAEAAINHLSGRTALERTYDRHDYGAEILAALRLWQGHVAGVVGAAGAVVAMERRRAGTDSLG
jgi:integrase